MGAKKKVRVHEWVNTETFDPLYGVQVLRSGKWLHAVTGTEFALFPTKQEAEVLAVDIEARLAVEAA